jgi:ABC-type transporter Mla MlaB component
MTGSGPYTVAFAIYGPINRTDLSGLCARVCGLLEETPGDIVLCDVAGVEPDAMTVDALARLQLSAQRRGCIVRLRSASEELVELVGFMGLTEVLVDR